MKFKLLLFSFILFSCSSSHEEKNIDLSSCKVSSDSVDKRSLVTNINVNSKRLSRCLKNYLLFSKKDEFSYSGCVRLLVSKRGSPRDVRIYPSSIPNDLQMCIEQEIWSFDFKDLSLSTAQRVQFPINLKR